MKWAQVNGTMHMHIITIILMFEYIKHVMSSYHSHGTSPVETFFTTGKMYVDSVH